MTQHLRGDYFTIQFPVMIVAAPTDDQDAFAAAAMGRLDDKFLIGIEQTRQFFYLMFDFDDTVQFGNGDAEILGELFGQQLVVHQRVIFTRVVNRRCACSSPKCPVLSGAALETADFASSSLQESFHNTDRKRHNSVRR